MKNRYYIQLASGRWIEVNYKEYNRYNGMKTASSLNILNELNQRKNGGTL